MKKTLLTHHNCGYFFLPGIAPYSSGVIASPGHEIVHVTLKTPMPWNCGLLAARSWLESRGLDRRALCGVELRCPEPHSLTGFAEFNGQYQTLLEEWEILVDGQNPVVRTNVAPLVNPPKETQLFGFSFVEAGITLDTTFVVAGGGELPHCDLERRHIVRVGETSADAMQEKATCVLRIMRHRLECLGADESFISTINVYTVHSLKTLFLEAVIPELPAAARLGVRWYCSRPPIKEIEFEMDLRGVCQDLTVDLRRSTNTTYPFPGSIA